MKHRRETDPSSNAQDYDTDYMLPFDEHVRVMEQVEHADTSSLDQDKDQKSRFEGLRGKIGRTLGIAGVAAVMLIPVYELAASDAAMAKVYNGLDSWATSLEHKTPMQKKAIEDLGTLAIIEAEVLITGSLIARNNKLRAVFQDSGAYVDEKQKDMIGVRKAISTFVNTPYMLIGKVGDGVAKAGEKLDETDNKAVAFIGKRIVNVGAVNAIGTNGVVMGETMNDNPPSTGRIAELGAAIGLTWVGPAEGIRVLNRHFPNTIGRGMHGIGWAYTELTHMNVVNPLEAPVGNLAMGSAAVAMIYTGTRMALYHDEQKKIRAAKENAIIDYDPLDAHYDEQMAIDESADLEQAVAALNIKAELV
ncbi:MAG: hypothetical protein JWO07_868 [Candidatus Saccharibacteria bacterium]|nr:hypothetical protein [Candidatus Saccharibacteria bacterium]